MTDILCIVSKFALAFTLLIFGEFVIEQEIDDTKWNKDIFIRTRWHDVVSCQHCIRNNLAIDMDG